MSRSDERRRQRVPAVLLGTMFAALGCTDVGLRASGEEAYGRPGPADDMARRSIQPEQPAVQQSGTAGSPGTGFDIRLVRVQPGLHIRTVQSCDVVLTGRAEGVEGREAARYGADVAQRMAVKCHAPTGEGWADLVFSRDQVRQVSEVRRGRRVRVRILAADGGYFDYPIVEFVAVDGDHAELVRSAQPAPQANVSSGFDLTQVRGDPSLIGSLQSCSVAFADEVHLIEPVDRRGRSYPAGVQNRMTVRCKHRTGEEPADLVFMPSQATAALSVQRGSVLSVRVVSANGGAVDYPVIQYAGE
jgi:hypothetical protein